MKLNEKLGVPDNILEIAEKLYSSILEELKSINDIDDTIKLIVPINDVIADMRVSKIKVNINFRTYPYNKIPDYKKDEVKPGDLLLSSMNVRSKVLSDSNTGIQLNVDGKKVHMNINLISIESDVTSDILLTYFENNLDNITSSFAHELMHKYHNFKKPSKKAIDYYKYASYSSVDFGIKGISDFTHYLYFIHTIENVVRPTEVASSMKSAKVTDDKFIDFLSKNSTYNMLRTIRDYKYEDLRNSIANEMDVVDEILEENTDMVFNNDDEKIDMILHMLYVSLTNEQLSSFKNFLTSSPIEGIIGLPKHKKELFTKVYNNIAKYRNNTKKFYTDTEKMFNFVANKYLRKISKLYDMTTKNSIIDWDLHQKINKKVSEKIYTKILDFKQFSKNEVKKEVEFVKSNGDLFSVARTVEEALYMLETSQEFGYIVRINGLEVDNEFAKYAIEKLFE